MILSAIVSPIIAKGQSQSDSSGQAHAPGGPPPIRTAKRAFYILVDPTSDRQSASLVAMSAAAELNKAFKPPNGGNAAQTVAWAIPEPSWKVSDFAQQCSDDPNAVGAVVLSYYAGDATHFWLLWQSQTTTMQLEAQVLSCNALQPAPGASPAARTVAPEIVAEISNLHGSNGTAWVERRTDASVPLFSAVLLVALLNHNVTKSEPTNVVTVATIGTAVVGQGFTKDIPGYSTPVRYRLDAQHVGVDVVRELRFLCGQPETAAPGNEGLANLCATFTWADAGGR